MLTANAARNLMNKSVIMNASQKASEQILNEISKLINKAAKNCRSEIILSYANNKKYCNKASKLYYNPYIVIEQADYTATQNIVNNSLKEAGYTVYPFYHKELRLKISW